jgi:hypothetical protein
MFSGTDYLFLAIVEDVFEVLGSNELCLPQLHDQAFPALLRAVSAPYDPSATASLIAGAMDIIGTLIKGSKVHISAAHAKNIFDTLFGVLLQSSDASLLQSGQICLRWIVQRDVDQLMRWCVSILDGNLIEVLNCWLTLG